MSSFVSTPPAAPAPPPAPAPSDVANDGFFPPVSIARTREILLMPTSVTDARLIDAIVGAIAETNRQLAPWRALQTAAELAEVSPADQLAGEPRLVLLYQRAVRAYAAAALADAENEISATDGGRERIETRISPADSHRRLAVHAIRDLLGKKRTKVRLV